MTKKRQTTEHANELGALGGFGPVETAQLVRLRELLIKHLLDKFEKGTKVSFTEVSAAMTLLRRAGLVDPMPTPEDAPDVAGEAPGDPQDAQATAQDAPGPIAGDVPSTYAPGRVRGSEGQELILPFNSKGEYVRQEGGTK